MKRINTVEQLEEYFGTVASNDAQYRRLVKLFNTYQQQGVKEKLLARLFQLAVGETDEIADWNKFEDRLFELLEENCD